MQSIVYIGMDVHQYSFSLCALSKDTGQILRETKCDAQVKEVSKFVLKLSEDFDFDQVVLGYEAGIWGYSLANALNTLGLKCIILAPSTMFNSNKHRMVKNDHQDARMIAHNLAAGTYKAVHIPDEQDDNVKEFVRLIKTLKKELTRIKQTISSFTLRNGQRYAPHHNHWTQKYMQWLDDMKLPALKREVLDEYIIHYHVLQDKIDNLVDKLTTISTQERYKKAVSKLRCIKGINTFSAMTILVETSDFKRFPNAKAYASYLGLTPMEHSSGDNIHFGQITKAGNTVIRTTLIECVQGTVRGKLNNKPKYLRARQKGQPARVIAYADRATTRLHKRYEYLMNRGKQRNVVITALARELAGFIWGMETDHIR